MIYYIKFNTEQEYRNWEQNIISILNVDSYCEPHTHPTRESVVVPYKNNPLIDTTNLNLISINHAIVQGYDIDVDFNEALKNFVKENKEFALDLENDFIAENISLGITQLGLTSEVSVYLEDIIKDIRNTSFYEAISKIDQKILDGVPANLAPVITEQRLLTFKQKIQDYLD